MPIIVGTYGQASIEKLLGLESALEQELLKRAVSTRAVKSADDAVVRDLRPVDAGNSGQVWMITAGTTATTIASGTNTDKLVWGVYAVSQEVGGGTFTASVSGSPAVWVATAKFMKGTGGATVKDIWNLQGRGIEQGKIVVGKAPVIFGKSETFRIDAVASSTAVLCLLGKVCEPKGELIDPE